MKKLFISIFTAVFALFALGTSTFAWFSMNTTAEAKGMTVRAIAGSSLQISKTTTFVTGNTSISFTEDGAYILEPAVEYNGQTGEEGASIQHSKQLVTVANGKDVDPNTGLAKEGKDLYYKEAATAATTEAKGYYVDYVMYLAAEGTDEPLTEGKLKITIKAPTSFSEYALQAVSILVLDKDGNKLCNTIRLQEGVEKEPIYTLSEELSIPAKVAGSRPESGALQVTFRVFIDGALEDVENTSTYVRNTKIVDLTNTVSFDVVFDLEAE